VNSASSNVWVETRFGAAGCVATREGNRSPLVVHNQGGMIVAVDLPDPEGSSNST
jgi:hypothetical protein